jgi:hypothetical protein
MVIKKAKCHYYLFINIIVAFYSKNSNYSNETDENIFGNKIIILKTVKSLRQLRKTEKELVRLNYKEAVIKGFTLKGIQQYIASKTKIWIEWPYLETLKKAEEQENREWFYHMAKDHFAYVGAYRKCIDEIEQLKKEVWSILMDTNTTRETKILATKELHSLCKTYTLLIKDLPFVTNLSKYYDKDMLHSSYANSSYSKGTYSNRTDRDINRNSIERKDSIKPENSGNPFECDIVKANTKEDNILEDNNCELSPKYKQVDDQINETMQAQLNYGDNAISKEHLEGIKRLKKIFDD